MNVEHDVIVAGAGPVGLLLAIELRLGGANPLVLERLDAPTSERKARGIGPLAAEALARRGFADALAAHHADGLADLKRDHGSIQQHFAWIHKIDPARQAEPRRAHTLIWQPELERILAARLAELGVQVLRGHTLTAIGQQDTGVEVTVHGGQAFRAPYLVGCDGGRSTVRKLAGFEFPGTPPIMVQRRASAHIEGVELLPPPGRTPHGALFHGSGMIGTVEFDTEALDRDQPLGAAELAASVRRVSGVDVRLGELHDTLRFSDNARQAAGYRQGRVLLAGDAAHVHSPNGGQGLNLGLMDAVNLGWKLAATVLGKAPDGLLDSYTTERHPVGAAVLHNTRAQSALLRPGPHTEALRDIVADLLDIQEVNRYFWRMLNGLDTRYEMPYPATDPLVGRPCQDLAVDETMLSALMESGRGLLIQRGEPALGPRYRLGVVRADRIGEDLHTLLVRPDGTIAFAARTGENPDPTLLEAAADAWFVRKE